MSYPSEGLKLSSTVDMLQCVDTSSFCYKKLFAIHADIFFTDAHSMNVSEDPSCAVQNIQCSDIKIKELSATRSWSLKSKLTQNPAVAEVNFAPGEKAVCLEIPISPRSVGSANTNICCKTIYQ